MKNLIFLGVASALLCACNDSLENTFLLADGDSKMTRSVISEVSPVFAWDDTTHISLYNVPGPVLLPWYSGAATSIPSFILDSYKASDGWQLVYNTCSPSNITQDDLYYLLFYNIFSGKLRGYVYNKNDVTTGDMTFWQLSFNNGTTLLNDLTPNTTPGTTPVSERTMLVSNLSENPTKALTRGWNAFEADFLVYDPNISNKNIAMTISAYDVDQGQIEMLGNINMESSGTMVTTTTINSFSAPNFLTQEVSLLGDAAKEKYEEWFETEEKPESTRSFLSGTVAEIVKAGGNFLVNKFFGRASTQTMQSNSDIKISTNGKIYSEGTITSQQQSNISPLARLMLPGSNPTPEDIFLRSNDKPFGVWYLEKAPEVKFSAYECFFPTFDGGVKVVGVHGVRNYYEFDESSISVKLNPAIMPFIEKYEVSARYLYILKAGEVPSYKVVVPDVPGVIVPHGRISFTELNCKKEFFSAQDSLLVFAGNPEGTFKQEYLRDGLREDVITGEEYTQMLKKQIPYETTWDVEPLGVIKVTVTLYPKAPYDTMPIVTTRTFTPKIIKE